MDCVKVEYDTLENVVYCPVCLENLGNEDDQCPKCGIWLDWRDLQ